MPAAPETPPAPPTPASAPAPAPVASSPSESGIAARLASLVAPAESEINRWRRTFDKHAGVERDGKK